MGYLLKYAKKKAGYDQGGSKNNNWGGDSVGYSAKHKRRANETGNHKRGNKCARCGSTKNLQSVTVHGSNGKKFITLCASCHAKYDKKGNNFKKEGNMTSLLKFAEKTLGDAAAVLAVDRPDARGNGSYNEIIIEKDSPAVRSLRYPIGAFTGGSVGAAGGPLGAIAGALAGTAAAAYGNRISPVRARAFMKDMYPSGRGDEYAWAHEDTIPSAASSEYEAELADAGFHRIAKASVPRTTGSLESLGYTALGGGLGGGLGMLLASKIAPESIDNRTALAAGGVLGALLGGAAGYYGGNAFISPHLPSLRERELWSAFNSPIQEAATRGWENAVID